MAIDEEDWKRNGQNDMERIWMSNPVNYLCERHREKARKQEPTDCLIEDLRTERFPTWENREYFRRCIVGLSNIYDEIETVGGNIVRLTPLGLDSCRSIPGWYKDF
jgi:hypothetical protein